MSAVWCVKCNFSTIILLKSHDKVGVAPRRAWHHGMAEKLPGDSAPGKIFLRRAKASSFIGTSLVLDDVGTSRARFAILTETV